MEVKMAITPFPSTLCHHMEQYKQTPGGCQYLNPQPLLTGYIFNKC